MSKALLMGNTGGESSDFCQEGKERDVYNILLGVADDLPLESNSYNPNPNPNPQELDNSIKVQYKGQIYVFNVNENTSMGEIKTILLNKLQEENVIVNSNQNVKFIYKGKIITKEEIVLSTLENPPFGITLQAMLTPKTGGRRKKTITKRRIKTRIKRKTSNRKK